MGPLREFTEAPELPSRQSSLIESPVVVLWSESQDTTWPATIELDVEQPVSSANEIAAANNLFIENPCRS